MEFGNLLLSSLKKLFKRGQPQQNHIRQPRRGVYRGDTQPRRGVFRGDGQPRRGVFRGDGQPRRGYSLYI